jgi:hypothetical protein
MVALRVTFWGFDKIRQSLYNVYMIENKSLESCQ